MLFIHPQFSPITVIKLCNSFKVTICQSRVYRWQGCQAQESQTECKIESFNECPHNMLHNTNKNRI